MGLRTKLNLLLVATAVLGGVLFAAVLGPYASQLARDEVVQNARIMMSSAAGTRLYTSRQVAPLLIGQMRDRFYPQAVSAYAAVKGFEVLHAEFPDYAYREPALNPTNMMDRATDWESDIIQRFRAHPALAESLTVRQTIDGPQMELARPLRADPACLACHSTPGVAPKTMLAQYGPDHGFGWKDESEIVAAQIVSAPMRVAETRADRIRIAAMAIYLGVLAVLAVVLNVGLSMLVTDPVRAMARAAEDVSLGKTEAPELEVRGSDEIAGLARAFTRMRRSLEEAMRLLGARGPR